MKTYVAISFLTVATMALSNSSLEYLNYPTQVLETLKSWESKCLT